jgi:hypothetical protein
MSETERHRFRRGILLTAISALLLAADSAILISADYVRFNSSRPLVFWMAFLDFWINGAALFSFLRPLWGLLPFAASDASDVTPAGIILGLVVFFMQAVLAFFWVLCLFAP